MMSELYNQIPNTVTYFSLSSFFLSIFGWLENMKTTLKFLLNKIFFIRINQG